MNEHDSRARATVSFEKIVEPEGDGAADRKVERQEQEDQVVLPSYLVGMDRMSP